MKLKIDATVCWQRVDGQVYITRENEFVMLNKSASLIWMGIYQRKSNREIISYLLEQYDVDEAVIESDINEITDSLIEKGFVRYE